MNVAFSSICIGMGCCSKKSRGEDCTCVCHVVCRVESYSNKRDGKITPELLGKLHDHQNDGVQLLKDFFAAGVITCDDFFYFLKQFQQADEKKGTGCANAGTLLDIS